MAKELFLNLKTVQKTTVCLNIVRNIGYGQWLLAKGKKDVNKSKVAVEKTATKATGPKIDQSVCTGGNIFKDGDDPPLKEDGGYPDWLWGLTDHSKNWSEFSPDSREYWRRKNKTKAHTNNRKMKLNS